MSRADLQKCPTIPSGNKIKSNLLSSLWRSAAAFVVLCATLVATDGATAQPLSVVGGEGARTLVLHLCSIKLDRSKTTAQALASGSCRSKTTSEGGRIPVTTTTPTLVGALTLDVANGSSKPERIAIRYIRADGASAHLPGTYSYVRLVSASQPNGRWLTIAPHATTALALHFTLTPGKPSSALEGALDVVLSGFRQVMAVPLKVSLLAPPGLRLEPGELTLSNDRGKHRPTTTLTLVGPGAGAFAGAADTRASFALYDANNDEVKLKLGAFSEVQPGIASATLSIANNPYPGAYKGEIALFSLSPSAPRLALKVNSHRSVWLVILLVLLGVAIGGLAPRLFALNQRRNTLFRELGAARRRFDAAENTLPAGVNSEIWSLGDLAEADSLPGEQTHGGASQGLAGVDALYAKIAEARNDRDLDGDTGAVLEVVARLQRWLRLAPTVWLLSDLVKERSPADQTAWRKTATWRDTRLLQESLLREPATVAAADDLVARVLWQIGWYRDFAELYSQANSQPKWGTLVGSLEKQMGKKSVLERTAAERDELSFAFERVGEELDVQLAREDYSRLSAQYMRLSGTPELTVRWRTTPNLFTGWATIDGTSWRALRTQAARSGRARQLRRVNATDPSPTRSSGAERLSRFGSAFLSGIVPAIPPLLAASIFYAVTIYSETWGSLTDIFTAITAGFVGKVAIDYGTLSIFQSRGLSLAANAPSPAATASATPTAMPPAPASSPPPSAATPAPHQ
jgi:hypothetical protein